MVDLTNKALHHGIAACGPGKHFRDIGQAIRESIKGFDVSISPQFTGHGIGSVFHHPPWIIHDGKTNLIQRPVPAPDPYILVNDEPGVMAPGHCFTIEVHPFTLPLVSLNHLPDISTACLDTRTQADSMDISGRLDRLHRGTSLFASFPTAHLVSVVSFPELRSQRAS